MTLGPLAGWRLLRLRGLDRRTADLVERFAADEAGQDVVEYALLAALVGIAAIVIWQQLVTTVGVVYVNADTGTQTLSACTPDPGGGGCP
jgi:Flp pilus assembly pilin Flp